MVAVIQYSITKREIDPVTCLIQSALTTYSSLVSFFLTILIAFHMFILIVFDYNIPAARKTILSYNAISWLLPAIIITVALSQGALGADRSAFAGTGPWCWVDSNVKHSTFWMVITGKGWEILCYLTTTTFYVLLKLFICLRRGRVNFNEINAHLRREDKNLLYVWFLLYVVRVWGTSRFFIYTFANESDSLKEAMEVLLYLQAAGDPSQAFVNAMLFCVFDKSVRTRLCRRDRRDIAVQNNGGWANERTTLINEDSEHAGPSSVSVNSGYGTGTSTFKSRSSELSDIANAL